MNLDKHNNREPKEEKACRHFATYKAIYKPKCNCLPCWNKWIKENKKVNK